MLTCVPLNQCGLLMRAALYRTDTGRSDIVDAGSWGGDSLALSRRDLGARWVSADFRARDVLMFTMHAMHAAIEPASAEQLRLSADIRFQPRSEPVDDRYTAHGEGWAATPSDAQQTFHVMYNEGSVPHEERRRTMEEAKVEWGLLYAKL